MKTILNRGKTILCWWGAAIMGGSVLPHVTHAQSTKKMGHPWEVHIETLFLSSRSKALGPSMLHRVLACHEHHPSWAKKFPRTLEYAQACAEDVYHRHLEKKHSQATLRRDGAALLLFFLHHPPASFAGWKILHRVLRFQGKTITTFPALVTALERFWCSTQGLSSPQYTDFLQAFGEFLSSACHSARFQNLCGKKRLEEAKIFLDSMHTLPSSTHTALSLAHKVMCGKCSPAAAAGALPATLNTREQDILRAACVFSLLQGGFQDPLSTKEGKLDNALTTVHQLYASQGRARTHEGHLRAWKLWVGKFPLSLAASYQRLANMWRARGDEKAWQRCCQKATTALALTQGAPWIPAKLQREGQERLGILSFHVGKYSAATHHFQKLLALCGSPYKARHHRLVAKALYFQGLCWQHLQDPAQAAHFFQKAAAYPLLFHGQLAHAHLGKALKVTATPARTCLARTLPRPLSQAAQEILAILAVWEAVDPLGRNDGPLTTFLHESTKNLKTDEERLHFLQALMGWLPSLGPYFARKLFPGGHLALTELYPLLPQAWLSPRKIPHVALIHGVILQESAFNPLCRDALGGQGLMQIMPDAAADSSARQGIPHENKRLLEPLYNLRIGQEILLWHLRLFQGSYVLAVAAYNAGRNRVLQWLGQARPPHSPQERLRWMESALSPHTRHYVHRVLENYIVYRSLLGHPVQPQEWDDIVRITPP